MARKYEREYRLREKDDVLVKMNKVLQDLDLRADAIEIIAEAFKTGNRADVDALVKAINDDFAEKSAELAELAAEFEAGFTPERIAETAEKRFTSDAEIGELQDADAALASALSTGLGTKVNSSTFVSHRDNTNNPHGVTKEQVGLGSVEDIAPADMPVSTAQAEAIGERVKLSSATVQPLSGGLSQAVVTLTPVAGVLTLDFSLGNHFKATLTANTSLVVTNLPAAGRRQEFTLDVIQDATGGRTLSYSSAFKWPGKTAAPSITTTANAINTLSGFANDTEVVTGFAGSR